MWKLHLALPLTVHCAGCAGWRGDIISPIYQANKVFTACNYPLVPHTSAYSFNWRIVIWFQWGWMKKGHPNRERNRETLVLVGPMYYPVISLCHGWTYSWVFRSPKLRHQFPVTVRAGKSNEECGNCFLTTGGIHIAADTPSHSPRSQPSVHCAANCSQQARSQHETGANDIPENGTENTASSVPHFC